MARGDLRPNVQTSTFLSLAPELLELIVLQCDPVDISRLARTCAQLRALVYAPTDGHLWREFHLGIFDDPRLRQPLKLEHRGTASQRPYDWRANLQKRIAARQELKRAALNLTTPGEMLSDETLRTLLDIVHTTAPAGPVPGPAAELSDMKMITTSPSPLDPSRSLSWLSELLVPVIDAATWRPPDWPVIADKVPESVHLRSRLLVYFGHASSYLTHALRTNARVSVYSWSSYSSASYWGPFMPDHSWRVNWYAMDSLMVVILMNLEEDEEFLPPVSTKMPPRGLEATRPGFWNSQGEDWAGVTGHWRCVCVCASAIVGYSQLTRTVLFCQFRRIVCFMDCEGLIRSFQRYAPDIADLGTFFCQTRILLVRYFRYKTCSFFVCHYY
jgi:hypothetical protein